ncbi:MAG: SgcJ/EcaC family oxidoreductase [Sphingomonas bacterium]
MRGMILLGLLLATPVAGQTDRPMAASAATAQAGVAAAMDDSAAGWNAGNLERFVAVYAPDATFVTEKGLVRGRAAIADRYRPSFTGGANKRSKLSFETLGSRIVSPTHLLLWARWTLTPADTAAKDDTGMTTLLFERGPEGWRIISDHSS